MKQGFAVWLTGTPASGKSRRARALKVLLEKEGVKVQHLESDELRKALTPNPTYSQEEREWFYGVMLYIGKMLADNGVNVILDATGNLRRYRDAARAGISRFCEVYVYCPQDVCIERDPKDIYKNAAAGSAANVPGIGSAYEPPENPEVTVQGHKEEQDTSAATVVAWMKTNWPDLF
jgi:adenylylsulfate kinase